MATLVQTLIQFNLLVMFLGVPFFVCIAMLERHKNPLLTRGAHPSEIDKRVSACATAAVMCGVTFVLLAISLVWLNKKEEEKHNTRRAQEIRSLEAGLQLTE